MDNYEIIESLSNTSAFNTNQNLQLILKLKNNLKLDPMLNEHLDIRKKISNRQVFADAQADCLFTYDF